MDTVSVRMDTNSPLCTTCWPLVFRESMSIMYRPIAVVMVAAIGTGACDVRLRKGPSQEEFDQIKARVAALEEKLAGRAQDKARRDIDLSICLEEAEMKYWNHIKLNGRKNRAKSTADSVVWIAPTSVWNHAEEMKRNATEACRIQHAAN